MPTFPQILPQTQAAIEFAERMHAGRQRGDGTPFMLRPLEVGWLLDCAGAADHPVGARAHNDHRPDHAHAPPPNYALPTIKPRIALDTRSVHR